MYTIYDHEAEYSISDVPKHSSDGGLKPPWIYPPHVKSSRPPESLKSNNPPGWAKSSHIYVSPEY